MRLNAFIAQQTGLSRRASDALIATGRVKVNDCLATLGAKLDNGDTVTIKSDGQQQRYTFRATAPNHTTILMNKPTGYVCSRDGQGSKTVYDLLPKHLHTLKTVGRLDKDSSGLLLMTDDGQLNQTLTHPKYQKTKVYEIELDSPLTPLHQQMISDFGVQLEDGPSKLGIEKMNASPKHLRIRMTEGRNRQIRRTFASLGYVVEKLHRTEFGPYSLGQLQPGEFVSLPIAKS